MTAVQAEAYRRGSGTAAPAPAQEPPPAEEGPDEDLETEDDELETPTSELDEEGGVDLELKSLDDPALIATLKTVPRLVDVIDILQRHGIQGADNLVAACKHLMAKVPALGRVTRLEERIARQMELAGTN